MLKEKYQILLVEDDKVDQLAFSRVLKQKELDYEYFIASSISEAKAMLASNSVDLVICDFLLDDGTAFDIFDHCGHLPVIVTTGAGDEEIAVRAMKMGAYDYLIKDHERKYLEVLPLTLKNAIRQHQADRKIKLLSHAIMNIKDSIFVTDVAGRIIFINRAFCDTYGYSENEIMGKSDDVLWPGDGYPDPLFDAKIDKTGTPLQGEFKHVRKNGTTFPTEISRSMLEDDMHNVTATVHVVRDITDRKKAEEEKERMKNQLLHTQKIEAVGILAGGVAHDFNNLLTIVQGYTDLLMLDIEKSSQEFENLKGIEDAVACAKNLTKQLLLFSTKQQIELKPLNLSKMMQDMKMMITRLIGEEIQVTTDFVRDPWTILGDRGSLERVILNIAVNARDAMPVGGELIIKIENRVLGKNFCQCNPGTSPGKYVCLTLKDNGIGIEADSLSHIFEPFFTTKGLGKGTGLGLSVAYGIIRKHDGWINVNSQVGEGTEFIIFIPIFSEKHLTDPATEISITEDLNGSGERILVVEDEDGVRDLTAKILDKNGYKVQTVSNAAQALDTFEKEKGDFELVMSDVDLPDKDGIQLAEKLVSLKPGLKVLMSSGHADEKANRSAIKERNYPFLEKPYSPQEMLRLVKEALSRYPGMPQ